METMEKLEIRKYFAKSDLGSRSWLCLEKVLAPHNIPLKKIPLLFFQKNKNLNKKIENNFEFLFWIWLGSTLLLLIFVYNEKLRITQFYIIKKNV